MKQLIIGDIHGCYDELQALLDKAGLTSDDDIIALGDLVDRGPESPRVLEFFRTTPNARSIQGNHERKHVRCYRGEIDPALSQLIVRWQLGDGYADAVTFMDSLPRWLELPDALLIHAFFEPGVPLADQREDVIVGAMSGQKYLTKNYDRLWFEQYDGAKPLIVGHKDYSSMHKPLVYNNRVYGIDTRCYEGGALTGLILPDFKLISVPSRKDYWTAAQRLYTETE